MDFRRDVSDARAAFYHATAALGLADQVATFTASEFGHSLPPSGTGTDHGWGHHPLITGGAVKGGDLYGTFPDQALGGADDTGNRGVLIPTTSVDPFGGTCAKWFGEVPADLGCEFPQLDDNCAVQDLEFLT